MTDTQGAAWWSWQSVADESVPAAELKMDQPHSARIYDYLLGGKDNFPADRDGAEEVIRAFPTTVIAARQNRAFMLRATRYLARASACL
jgi:hypothetical protein